MKTQKRPFNPLSDAAQSSSSPPTQKRHKTTHNAAAASNGYANAQRSNAQPHIGAMPPVDAPRSAHKLPPPPPLAPGELSTAPFIHASVADSKHSAALNYERLEFLGDAVLELIATRLIFSTFPTLSVGRQSQLRERLVRNTTLADFSCRYGFPERLNGHSKEIAATKVYADVFEAYVAAITLSSSDGFDIAERWLRELWAPIIEPEKAAIDAQQPQRNWKQELQDKLIGYNVKIEYRWLDKDRKDGAKDQMVEEGVFLTGWGFENEELGRGRGKGHKAAGMVAARMAMENSWDKIEIACQRKEKHLEERRKLKEQQELDK